MKYIIADVGSTTTKVLLIQDDKIVAREEAKTTVEKPDEDVFVGLESAIRLIKYKCKKEIGNYDLLCSSSAGGGLQIVAIGITGVFTAKSAYHLAMNSGAIVIDTISLDDGRIPLQRIQAFDQAKPDLVLFAGGFEGGAIDQLVEIAELINLSEIHPKFEMSKLPIVFAGNSSALPFVKGVFGDRFLLKVVPNINPQEDMVNFDPAREAILDTFIEHVMSAAPGYKSLCEKTVKPPLPTPLAFDKILTLYARRENKKIFAFDMGGATTDCYSITEHITRRSVAANLGMTYSLPFVLKQCGLKNIMFLLGREYKSDEVLNFIGNRYIRPVTISETDHELRIEEAIAQNVIAESFKIHHDSTKAEYDLVIASGGFVAHHPSKTRIRQIISEALHLAPTISVAIDKSFILPHLGVLSQVDESLALKLFEEDVTTL